MIVFLFVLGLTLTGRRYGAVGVAQPGNDILTTLADYNLFDNITQTGPQQLLDVCDGGHKTAVVMSSHTFDEMNLITDDILPVLVEPVEEFPLSSLRLRSFCSQQRMNLNVYGGQFETFRQDVYDLHYVGTCGRSSNLGRYWRYHLRIMLVDFAVQIQGEIENLVRPHRAEQYDDPIVPTSFQSVLATQYMGNTTARTSQLLSDCESTLNGNHGDCVTLVELRSWVTRDDNTDTDKIMNFIWTLDATHLAAIPPTSSPVPSESPTTSSLPSSLPSTSTIPTTSDEPTTSNPPTYENPACNDIANEDNEQYCNSNCDLLDLANLFCGTVETSIAYCICWANDVLPIWSDCGYDVSFQLIADLVGVEIVNYCCGLAPGVCS